MEFLKCDANGCAHIETHPKLTSEMVGTSCPKCGADLLTQKDFDDFVKFTIPVVNLSRAIGLTVPIDEGSGGTTVRFGNHNGTFYISPTTEGGE
jgi:hypothetical protein